MDWHDGYFRVFSQRWYGDDALSLFVVSTQHPDDLDIDDRLRVGHLMVGLLVPGWSGP